MKRSRGILGIVIPNAKTLFDKAVVAARLGGIACHLMLQRLADPAVPPLEVLLD